MDSLQDGDFLRAPESPQRAFKPSSDDASTSTFPPEIDQPAGRVDGVPSAVTGRPLRYYTPAPLPVLLDRCRLKARQPRGHLDKEFENAGLLLVRPASRRGHNNNVDLVQAARFAETLLGSMQPTTADEMLGLGKRLSPRVTGPREEIVFSGGPSASDAHLIYSPPASIAPLLMSLEEGLTEIENLETDPLVLIAVIGFFCIHLHPFVDANGRWTRLVMAATGVRCKASLSAMVQASMHNLSKREFGERIWPQARFTGLRKYLSLTMDFEQNLLGRLGSSGVLLAFSVVNKEIMGQARNRKDAKTVLAELFVNTEIATDKIKNKFGLSTRSLAGFLDRINVAGPMVNAENGKLSVKRMLEVTEQELSAGKDNVLRETN